MLCEGDDILIKTYLPENFFSNIISAKVTKEKKKDKIPFKWDKEIVFETTEPKEKLNKNSKDED